MRPLLFTTLVSVVAAASVARVLAAAGPEPAREASAAAWVAFAKSCFAGRDTVEAGIAYEVIHPLGAAQPPRHGVLRLTRGGLFRLEVGAHDPIVVVSDGRLIRSWDPASRLVVEEPAEGSALAAAFAFALGKEGGVGTVRWLGGGAQPEDGLPSALAIELDGTAPSVARVGLALAPTCPSLTRIVIGESRGTAIRITLGDVRLGVRFPGRPFAFTPPRGARIVSP